MGLFEGTLTVSTFWKVLSVWQYRKNRAKMKVARYYGQNDIRIEDMSIPEIDENDALVEMRAC